MRQTVSGVAIGVVLGAVAVSALIVMGNSTEATHTFKTPCEIDVEMKSAESIAGDCCGNDEWRTRFYYNPIRVHFDRMQVDIELTAEARERDPSSDDIGRKTKTVSMTCKPNEVERRTVTIDAIACEDGPAFGPCRERDEHETWRFQFNVVAEGPVTEEAFQAQ